MNAGTLQLCQSSFSAGSTVTIANGAILQLDFTTTNVINQLVLNGVSQPTGFYNNTTSPSFILGPGTLQVVPVNSTPTNITVTVKREPTHAHLAGGPYRLAVAGADQSGRQGYQLRFELGGRGRFGEREHLSNHDRPGQRLGVLPHGLSVSNLKEFTRGVKLPFAPRVFNFKIW